MGKKDKENVVFLILLIGIFYFLNFFSCIKKGVFFTPDNGLKYLQTKQIANGNFNLDLEIEESAFVKSIWKKGFYPFSLPYVYKIGNKYYSVFPYLFSLISAPFLKIFGFYGIYFVPFLSLIGIWIVFILFLKNFKIDVLSSSIFLSSLIFSTPVSFYGVVYWEHTLSLFLFLSFCYLYFVKKYFLPSAILLFLSQVLRPELFVITFFLILYFILKRNLDVRFFTYYFFLIFLLVVINLYFFKTPFGLRFLQQRGINGFKKGIGIYLFFLKLFVKFFPVYFLSLFLFFFKIKEKKYLFFELFLLILPLFVSFFVPNGGGAQRGPRYLLFLMPLSLIFLLIFYNDLKKKTLKISFTVFFLLFSIFSFHRNTIISKPFLCVNVNYKYENLIKVIEYSKEKNIVSCYLNTSMYLVPLFSKKNIFLLRDFRKIFEISNIFMKKGIRSFIFIKEGLIDLKVPETLFNGKVLLSFTLIKKSLYGKIYRVTILNEE